MLKVGDRISYENYGEGTVISVSEYNGLGLCVEFDNFTGGHDGYHQMKHSGKEGSVSCWWINKDDEDIKLLKPICIVED